MERSLRPWWMIRESSRWAAARLECLWGYIGCEHMEMTVRSDQEPSVRLVVSEVCRLRGNVRTVAEESPVGSSGSNGVVEGAIRSVVEQARILRIALQDRLKCEVSPTSAVMAWIVDHAATVCNQRLLGSDGLCAYERVKRKAPPKLPHEFGEVVWWKPCSGPHKDMLEPRSRRGFFVGVRARSGDILVADAAGLWKCRATRRAEEGERWHKDFLDTVARVPGDNGREGGGPTDDEARQPGGDYVQQPPEPGPEARTFHSRQGDVLRHGASPGCMGCLEAVRGNPRGSRPHGAECRARFAEAMVGERVAKAKRRAEAAAADGEDTKRRPGAAAGSSQDEAGGGPAEVHVGDEEMGPDPRTPPGLGPRQRVADDDGGEGGDDRNRMRVRFEDEEDLAHTELPHEMRDVEPTPDELMQLKLECIANVDSNLEAEDGLDPGEVAAAKDEELRFIEREGVWQVIS